MILFNFSTTIIYMAVVEKGSRKHTYQVNFSMAMKLCIGYLQACGNGCDIISLMSKFILPIRENRIYARQHRFHSPVREERRLRLTKHYEAISRCFHC